MPAMAGRPGFSGQYCSTRLKITSFLKRPPDAFSYPYPIEEVPVAVPSGVFHPLGGGVAGALAHVRVSTHQAISSRNVLPRPLSPVRKLMRGLKWISISGEGPTFVSFRYLSIGSFSSKQITSSPALVGAQG